MQRTISTSATLLALLSAGCPPAEQADPPGPPPNAIDALPPVAEMERTESCPNQEIGFTIEYPAGWHTNPGDVMPQCSLFDPDPIEIEPATELPFVLPSR